MWVSQTCLQLSLYAQGKSPAWFVAGLPKMLFGAISIDALGLQKAKYLRFAHYIVSFPSCLLHTISLPYHEC
jgi:hypothetical protein